MFGKSKQTLWNKNFDHKLCNVQCGILKAAELTAALELDKELFIKFSSHSAKVGALAEISPLL